MVTPSTASIRAPLSGMHAPPSRDPSQERVAKRARIERVVDASLTISASRSSFKQPKRKWGEEEDRRLYAIIKTIYPELFDKPKKMILAHLKKDPKTWPWDGKLHWHTLYDTYFLESGYSLSCIKQRFLRCLLPFIILKQTSQKHEDLQPWLARFVQQYGPRWTWASQRFFIEHNGFYVSLFHINYTYKYYLQGGVTPQASSTNTRIRDALKEQYPQLFDHPVPMIQRHLATHPNTWPWDDWDWECVRQQDQTNLNLSTKQLKERFTRQILPILILKQNSQKHPNLDKWVITYVRENNCDWQAASKAFFTSHDGFFISAKNICNCYKKVQPPQQRRPIRSKAWGKEDDLQLLKALVDQVPQLLNDLKGQLMSQTEVPQLLNFWTCGHDISWSKIRKTSFPERRCTRAFLRRRFINNVLPILLLQEETKDPANLKTWIVEFVQKHAAQWALASRMYFFEHQGYYISPNRMENAYQRQLRPEKPSSPRPPSATPMKEEDWPSPLPGSPFYM